MSRGRPCDKTAAFFGAGCRPAPSELSLCRHLSGSRRMRVCVCLRVMRHRGNGDERGGACEGREARPRTAALHEAGTGTRRGQVEGARDTAEADRAQSWRVKTGPETDGVKH